MKILFTCCGSRNYLLDFFKAELTAQDEVLATDASRYAPALVAADKGFLVPRLDSPGYIDALLNIVRKEEVTAVISLNDLELPILAEVSHRFDEAGARLLVSDPHVIDICFDKWKTANFFEKIGIKSPKTFICLETAIEALESGSLSLPLVVKPRWGSQSIAVRYVNSADELRNAYSIALRDFSENRICSDDHSAESQELILIQEKLSGTEFGLDIINDLNGTHITTIVKEKHAMRAGETDIASVKSIPELETAGSTIAAALKHMSIMDADFFITAEGVFGLELNPRFGGGYPFSHMAGVNLPKAIIGWLRNTEIDKDVFEPRLNSTYAKHNSVTQVALSDYENHLD